MGGSATYFTLAAQHFASVSVVGVVGADREGELRETLRAADLRHLSVSPRPTYAWHASRGHGADAVTVNRFEGAYDRYEPQLPSAAAWPATVFLGSCAPRTQLAVIEAAPPGTVFAGDSMDIFISANHGEVERMVSRLRYLLLTETELSMLARSRGIATSAIWALERFTMDALVIKRGPQGAVLWTRDGSARLPACPVQVVDPTGAGDALAGAFLGRLQETAGRDLSDLVEALQWGMVAAAFTVEAPGIAGLRAVTRKALEKRRASYLAGARV